VEYLHGFKKACGSALFQFYEIDEERSVMLLLLLWLAVVVWCQVLDGGIALSHFLAII
jgi:hypothetical protein